MINTNLILEKEWCEKKIKVFSTNHEYYYNNNIDLKDEINTLKSKNSCLNDKLNACETELKKEKNLVHHLSSQIEEWKKQTENHKKCDIIIKEYKEKIDACKTDLEKEKKICRVVGVEELEQRNKRIKELERINDDYETKYKNDKNLIKGLQECNDTQSTTIKELQERNNAQYTTIKKCDNTINTFADVDKNHNIIIQKLKTENDTLQNDYNKLEVDYESLIKQVKDNYKTVQDYKTEIDEYKKKYLIKIEECDKALGIKNIEIEEMKKNLNYAAGEIFKFIDIKTKADALEAKTAADAVHLADLTNKISVLEKKLLEKNEDDDLVKV
jgi:chromosome segregation ATPase